MTTITLPRAVVEQALEALESVLCDPDGKCCIDGSDADRAVVDKALAALRAALARQAEPVQDQDVEDAIEAAYWQFDCRRSGLNEWASAPQSERDAFKAEARKLVRGYFPTRQAQDTKREMLAVADAFIRGKRAALAQQAEPEPQTCTWQQDGDSDSGVYGTSCGGYFNIEDGTPADNKMAWCCYCGKKLAQELITENKDD